MGIDWKSIKKDGYPKEDGEYIVTRGCPSIGYFLDLIKFTNDLHSINDYDFPADDYKGKKGFYKCEGDWDYFEMPYVIAWAKIETYKGE